MAVDWGYDFYCESQNIQENYSIVRLKIWIDMSGESHNYYWQTGTVWFAGEDTTDAYQLPSNSRTMVYNVAKRYNHNNNDGTCSASFNCAIPTTSSGGTKGPRKRCNY